MRLLLIIIMIFTTFSSLAETKLVWDQDYFQTLSSLIDNAKHTIKIVSFSFATDDGKGSYQTNGNAYKIASRLIELKKERGESINITIYLEGERSTSNRNQLTGDLLSKNGIQVKYGSTHAKGFVIDDKFLLFGSTNLTNQSMNKNNETNILTDDQSCITEFNKFFDNLIGYGKFGSIALKLPLIADGDYKNEIISSINQSKKTIEFSIYYFNDRDIENALINAHKRGIQISGYFNSLEIPGSDLVKKNVETIKRMTAEGLTDLHFALESSYNHSKFIIIDREKFLLGTGNWNFSDYTHFRQLYIKINDSGLASILSDHLQNQIQTETK